MQHVAQSKAVEGAPGPGPGSAARSKPSVAAVPQPSTELAPNHRY